MPYAGVHELLLEGPQRRGRAAAHPGLLVDVLDVMSDGLHRDAESVADRLVGVAADEREQHLELARREPGGQLARALGDPMAGRREHGRDGVRLEAALARFAQQLGLGRRRVERRPVRAGFAHRDVAVGGGEDAGRLVELGRAHAAVIAGAVEALVVRARDLADRCERRGLREGAFGEVRVQPHALPLSERERGGLLPDRVRHADAAEVMGERGAPDGRDVVLVEVRAPGGGLGKLGDGRAVLAQPRRLQAGDRGDRREPRVDRLAVQPDRRRGLDRRARSPTSASSSSSPSIASRFATASSARRGSYAAPERSSSTAQARSSPAAERNSEASLATCSRRIDIGICSPATGGRPSPSQRAKTYPSASWMLGRSPSQAGEALRDLAHRFQRFARPRAGFGDRLLEHLRANLRRPSEPDEGAIELEHLVRLGGVDQVEGGAVRDVVAEQLPRLVSVRGAAGRVQQRDVVGIGELVSRGARELAEPHREHGRANGVLERLPGAEVGRDRQRGDQLGGANRLLDAHSGGCGARHRLPPQAVSSIGGLRALSLMAG